MVTMPFTGGCMSSGFRFTAKVAMACSQASSVSMERSSRVTEGYISLLQASFAAASTCFEQGQHPRTTLRATMRSAPSSGMLTETLRKPSFSPRFIASTL